MYFATRKSFNKSSLISDESIFSSRLCIQICKIRDHAMHWTSMDYSILIHDRSCLYLFVIHIPDLILNLLHLRINRCLSSLHRLRLIELRLLANMVLINVHEVMNIVHRLTLQDIVHGLLEHCRASLRTHLLHELESALHRLSHSHVECSSCSSSKGNIGYRICWSPVPLLLDSGDRLRNLCECLVSTALENCLRELGILGDHGELIRGD